MKEPRRHVVGVRLSRSHKMMFDIQERGGAVDRFYTIIVDMPLDKIEQGIEALTKLAKDCDVEGTLPWQPLF